MDTRVFLEEPTASLQPQLKLLTKRKGFGLRANSLCGSACGSVSIPLVRPLSRRRELNHRIHQNLTLHFKQLFKIAGHMHAEPQVRAVF